VVLVTVEQAKGEKRGDEVALDQGLSGDLGEPDSEAKGKL